jgi:hypothetical protein
MTNEGSDHEPRINPIIACVLSTYDASAGAIIRGKAWPCELKPKG